jgi:hypothetical protein
MMNKEHRDMSYDTRHGGPFDRGSADSYYRRPVEPHFHFYLGSTTSRHIIIKCKRNTPEYEAYMAGYNMNQTSGDKKDWT